jgi:curved DNA-binding protein CbpA
VTRNRRAALDGLAKIMDAAAPEDLFTGAEDEALFLYELLADTTRGRSSSYYWEICRTARRRGVTPEYVVDRAAVLHTAMTERRRTDLFRQLGVPPLASEEVIRQRWLELAKRHHPDAGGNPERFRHAKQAFEILRDPTRRAEYERFWLRALGPFERVMPGEREPVVEVIAIRSVRAEPAARAEGHEPAYPVIAFRPRPGATVPAAAEPTPRETAAAERRPDALQAAARLLATRDVLDQRLASGVSGPAGLRGLLARVEAALAPVRREDLEALAADVRRTMADLEVVRARLDSLASLKQRVGA